MSSSKPSIRKFNFGELTSNESGKTSASGTAGLYIVFIGGVCFLLGCIERMFIDQSIDVITQSIVFVGLGAGLLGYRKSIKTKNSSISDAGINDTNPEIVDDVPKNTEEPKGDQPLNS